MMMMVGQAGNGGGGGGTRRCEDCGNQAKKECRYKRCRRCCKRKGFHCRTHVTSTWVPAACRRTTSISPLSLQPTTATATLSQHQHPHASGLSSNFAAEVNQMAIFRCCRVSSVLGGDGQRVPHDHSEEYAYQTAVTIGGHVFKGILYDQGRHEGETSSSNIPLRRTMQPHAALRSAPAAIDPPSSSYPNNFSLATSTTVRGTGGTQQLFFHPNYTSS